MSTVTILNHAVDAKVVKIRRGEELEAIKTARSDGQDNAFFKIGADTYVASGLGIHVHALGEMDDDETVPVTYQGRQGTLLFANNEQDDKGSLWFAGVGAGVLTAITTAGGLAGGGGFAFVLAPVLGLVILGSAGLYIHHVLANRAKARENAIGKHGTPA